MEIVRSVYREEGVRNGPTIVPLDLVAGIAERATPALAKNIAHGYARHDMRTHGEVLREAYCVPPPRATLERIAKGLAKRAYEAVEKVEKVAFRGEKLPEQACGITLGFDRTSAPMAEGLAPGEKKMAPKRNKPYVRAVPAPMAVNWRMAYIGTVCIVDKYGEAIKAYRYAATAADDPRKLTERMRLQVTTLAKQRSQLKMGIIQDGAGEMWKLMREVLQPLKSADLITGWHEAIDLPHLMGRLGEAFKIASDSSPTEIEAWKRKLIESNDTIDIIEETLKQSLPALSADEAKVVEKHLTYIDNNKDRMRYAKLRKANLPIGSGVTESTAKNVVNMRAKRSGQRWSIAGLRGVLNLRALLKSERLDKFWNVFSRCYSAQVRHLPAAA